MRAHVNPLQPYPEVVCGMQIVVAPQEFKGSLTAAEAARAIAEGARRAAPDAIVTQVPMSDGGAGLVEAMIAAAGGESVTTAVHGPLMRPVSAVWALLPGLIAAIEMAAASGLVLLAEAERDPLVATTYGTGELIRAALDRGCTRMIVGVGGSATVDAGTGAMQALGARLVDAAGHDLRPGGAALALLDHIELSGVDARLRAVSVRLATDVTNTLCGPTGAAVVFGPQKGASHDDVRVLDAALHRFAEIVARDCGIELLTMAGSGAAGGLSAGLVVAAGATIEPGFALVAEAVGLDDRIAAADIVLTGEGRLDAQTAYGKTAAGVAAMAHSHRKRIGVIAGSIDPAYIAAADAFDVVESAMPPGMALADAMRDAAALVRDAAERATRRLLDQERR